ncbi:MAG: LuxR C-terminal-related transcriptional regulator [Anaerolineales bacterium]
MSTPLLATKFFFPSIRSDIVPRPRLIQLLDNNLIKAGGFSRKLTLVSAPAGYGKTTLIAEWLEPSEKGGGRTIDVQPVPCQKEGSSTGLPLRIKSAWLQLDEADNDPRRFITYLIAALGNLHEEIGQTPSAMLHAPQPPPDEILLTALLNEITAVPRPILLVLDDYQVIRMPSIHQRLAFILDHQPAMLHLVITTREDPLLPIPRLRASGQVLEIRQEDLRFTVSETAEFLERVMGIPVAESEIAALDQRTEGWIAGLQLAALSMRGRDDVSGFIQAFTGSSRFILDYLIEEVFERQSPDLKDFLLKTSILDRFSAPLCDVLMEKTVSRELLEALEQSNLFIVPMDQSRLWYRYHHLFAELLRHRLRASHPDEEAHLHRRAGGWFEDQGLTADAIRHALAARDWRRAGSLIQRISPDLLKSGEVLTLLGWFQSLPEEILLSDPKLCFDYCWPLLLADRFEAAVPLLERLEQIAREMPAFLGEVFAAQAYLARGVGDHDRMVDRSRRALELLPKSSSNSRGIVAMNLGLAYWHMGRMRDAEEALAEALETSRASDNHYAALTSLIFLGRVFAVRGELRRAEGMFQTAIQKGDEIPVNALAYADLAALQYEWNRLEASAAYLQKAIVLSRCSLNDEFLVGCLMLESRLRIAQGDPAGAGDVLEQAWALVRGGRITSPMAQRMDAAQAFWLTAKGEAAREWGSKLTEISDGHPFYRFLGVTKARTMPDSQAMAYLEGLGRAAQANEWGYGLVAIRTLQASFAESREKAMEFLEDALRLAEGSGYIRTFAEAGEKIFPLLREAAEHGRHQECAGRILAEISEKRGKAGTGAAFLTEPLSERELDVLRLVAAGLSNREIAKQLVISPGTAKTHIHNLCGKLGVRNRTEAAIKAKELGLA